MSTNVNEPEWELCGRSGVAAEYETHWRVLESDPPYYIVRRVGSRNTFEKRADDLADFLIANGATKEMLRPGLRGYVDWGGNEGMGGLFD